MFEREGKNERGKEASRSHMGVVSAGKGQSQWEGGLWGLRRKFIILCIQNLERKTERKRDRKERKKR